MAIPAAVGWAAIGLQAAGTLFGGLSRSRASREQALMQRMNAGIARYQGQVEERQMRRDGQRTLGGMRASYGASGITMDGSATDVIASSVAELEYDITQNRFSRELEAMGFNASASAYGRQARDERTAGLLGTASSLLMGSYLMSNPSSAGRPVRV